MKRQNEFPGLENEQLQMLADSFPTGINENNLIYITGETGSGKTNTLNAVFAIIEKKQKLTALQKRRTAQVPIGIETIEPRF
jgi:Cdc6-like AAA superfamily ATPase